MELSTLRVYRSENIWVAITKYNNRVYFVKKAFLNYYVLLFMVYLFLTSDLKLHFLQLPSRLTTTSEGLRNITGELFS